MFKPNSLINYIENEIQKEFPNRKISFDLLYLLNSEELLDSLYMFIKIGSSKLDKRIKFQIFNLFTLDPKEFLSNKNQILNECFKLKPKDIATLDALTAIINRAI